MTLSLRLRLFAIILAPLLLISAAVGLWRINDARATAQELYDRNLLFTALAVARDVALRDGDAISRETEILLGTTSGGPVLYHVYAPDGVFVTGYATPPVPLDPRAVPDQTVAYFDARYKGRAMRVMRLKDVTTIGGFTGTFTITVWQDQAIRQEFVRDLALRALAVMAALIGTVGVVVWFGVNYGLKPLLTLEDAISARNSEDLSPIRRRVPREVAGIVNRLNGLFGQVTSTMHAQNDFIANAAHQLRNPLAGVRALGQSVQSARTLDAAHARAADLVAAAEEASNLANKLLTLERLSSAHAAEPPELVDLGALMAGLVVQMTPATKARNVDLQFAPPPGPIHVRTDALMLREAAINLIDNALTHGGEGLRRIDIDLRRSDDVAILTISDDGKGVVEQDIPKILARFGQATPGPGSGLGLPIAQAAVTRHGGTLDILTPESGFSVRITLPLARDA